MFAHNRAIGSDDLAGSTWRFSSFADKRIMFSQWYKADFLTVFFFSNPKPDLMGDIAYLCFLVFAYREHHLLKQFALNAKENVRLILRKVAAAHQGDLPPAVRLEAGVVPGCHIFGPNALGIFKQFSKLDPVVAHHARVGRATCGILINEIVDDCRKFSLQV